jgi:16S rRNA (guanine527-N7)-methyltransferase
MPSPAKRLVEICAGHGIEIDAERAGRLVAMLDRIALEPQNLTSVEAIEAGVERHLADSAVALVVDEVRNARTLCDIGSGGGFPGLVLAQLLPECAVTLVESERRKAEWLSRAAADSPNVRVVHDRSEQLARRERERFAVVTARALGALPVVLELAAPLVAVGGVFVAWRGVDRPGERAASVTAGAAVGLDFDREVRVDPVAGATRALQVWRKVDMSPSKFPRRPGIAAKRPLA